LVLVAGAAQHMPGVFALHRRPIEGDRVFGCEVTYVARRRARAQHLSTLQAKWIGLFCRTAAPRCIDPMLSGSERFSRRFQSGINSAFSFVHRQPSPDARSNQHRLCLVCLSRGFRRPLTWESAQPSSLASADKLMPPVSLRAQGLTLTSDPGRHDLLFQTVSGDGRHCSKTFAGLASVPLPNLSFTVSWVA